LYGLIADGSVMMRDRTNSIIIFLLLKENSILLATILSTTTWKARN